jgi:CHAT domain-containing protein/tetratricopeptide (TPR) repeat protein
MPKRLSPLAALLLACLLTRSGPSPTPSPATIWDSLLHIEQVPAARMSQQQKLAFVLSLRQEFEQGSFPEDSVYARLLHRIAVYQYYTTREYGLCVENTLHSIHINTSGKKGACLSFAVTSYKNMGFYYEGLLIYDWALHYFDSSIRLANRFLNQEATVKSCRQERSYIFALKGDFEKCIEEATLGIHLGEDTRDTAYRLRLLKQRAFAESKSGLYTAAISDIILDQQLALLTKDTVALAGSLDIKALIDASTGHADEAFDEYNQAIRLEILAGHSAILAQYYLDLGNLLMEKMGRLQEAEQRYHKGFQLALQVHDPIGAAAACIDLNVLNHNRRNYPQAISYSHQALQQLNVTPNKNPLRNPPFSALAALQDKQLSVIAFANKTDDLLQFYRQTRRQEVLIACVQTAQLTDSLITALRHEQTDDPSKLVWRTKTREFYSNALEACWLAHDENTAFFFMEKSRAVLLNDRLNELGASALLPPGEAARQQQLQLKLIEQEQQLADLPDSAPGYRHRQLEFLQAKDSLERYTRSLEQKAPAYYQYKYADSVPQLSTLQKMLMQDNRHFVHYFINDSLIYLLGISARDARLLRIPYRNFGQEIAGYLTLCADHQAQNIDYPDFASRSHHLYQLLLEPLGWKKGRILVSPDDFFIPFETLTTDSAGHHFLLYDFAFDYVYSARTLLQPIHNTKGDANFLGVAPARFAASLNIPDLPQSTDACRQAAACYPVADLLTGKTASRQNFLQKASHYSVVSVYAHARSDTSEKEPVLYLSDSVIRLSELPLLQHPATQLTVLSACYTNTGKNAAGEGIYSLARGFAAAGVPAVAATLWQADEQSTYAITTGLHRRLAQGFDKDQALRESKLEFIRTNDHAHSLPYFWANMILLGNPQPLVLLHSRPFSWWWPADLAVLLLVILLFCVKSFRNTRS